MKSLIKRYTKHTLHDIRGPVTVVAGKSRRLTFIECNNDLNSMIDIGKVADLVLMMIDGSFGFEMVSLKDVDEMTYLGEQFVDYSRVGVNAIRKLSNSSTFFNHMVSQKSSESSPIST